jgi:predicted ATPase
VTFIVGANGSGKSTLLEAIAVAAGLNAEGGGRNFAFATHETHSGLHRHLTLSRFGVPETDYFLRAESFYNVATVLDGMDDPNTFVSYGGRSLHEQSHGESFLALVVERFGPNGLYLLDEPEAALSSQGQLALLRRIHELANDGSQLVIATHSPILVALPDATILSLTERGIQRVDYDEVEHVQLYRSFLEDPERFLRHLLASD